MQFFGNFYVCCFNLKSVKQYKFWNIIYDTLNITNAWKSTTKFFSTDEIVFSEVKNLLVEQYTVKVSFVNNLDLIVYIIKTNAVGSTKHY